MGKIKQNSFLLLGIAACAISLAGCADNTLENIDAPTVTLTLHADGWQVSTDSLGTRALIDDDGRLMTDLWVMDGTDLLCHQADNTASDFGSPTISLTTGQHSISLIASRSDGQTYADGIWSCQKLRPTFGTSLSLDVTQGMEQDQPVTLARLTGQLKVAVLDAVPASACVLRIRYQRCESLMVPGFASELGEFTSEVSITTWAGTDASADHVATFNCLPSAPGTEYSAQLTLTILAADGSTLAERTLADVPMLSNRQTRVSGQMFGASGAMSATLLTTWTDAVDVSL